VKEKSEHIDEDKTFLLSLVPGFKKLDNDQKYWTKMEMLGIMRAKNSVSATVCTTVMKNDYSEFFDLLQKNYNE
jgi:hypothetical protein